MSMSWSSLVVYGASVDEITAALGSTAALISPEVDGVVFVFPDTHLSFPNEIAGPLSLSAGIRTVMFDVFDDEFFSALVWVGGELIAALSAPEVTEVWDITEDEAEALSDAMMAGAGMTPPSTSTLDGLVDALEPAHPDRARAVFENDFDLALDRHTEMLEALDLPTFSVGWGYRDLIHLGESYTGPPLRAHP